MRLPPLPPQDSVVGITQPVPLFMPSQSQDPAATGNCLFALYCSQRKEMEEQGPEENQALEIAVSVMTLSRGELCSSFIFQRLSFLRWFCSIKIRCLPRSPNVTTTRQKLDLPANSHTGSSSSAKPPFLLCHQLQKQRLPPPLGKAGHDQDEAMKEDGLPWRREGSSHVCRASFIQ